MAGTPLDFLGAVGFLMGRLGEEVTVAVGSVNPTSLVVQLSGTLVAKGSDVFDTEAAGQPVAFGFEENDATFYLDPETFRSARSGGKVMEVDLGYVCQRAAPRRLRPQLKTIADLTRLRCAAAERHQYPFETRVMMLVTRGGHVIEVSSNIGRRPRAQGASLPAATIRPSRYPITSTSGSLAPRLKGETRPLNAQETKPSAEWRLYRIDDTRKLGLGTREENPRAEIETCGMASGVARASSISSRTTGAFANGGMAPTSNCSVASSVPLGLITATSPRTPTAVFRARLWTTNATSW